MSRVIRPCHSDRASTQEESAFRGVPRALPPARGLQYPMANSTLILHKCAEVPPARHTAM